MSDTGASPSLLTVLRRGSGLENHPSASVPQASHLPELVVAFTRPQGADNDGVTGKVEDLLRARGFETFTIDIAGLIEQLSEIVIAAYPDRGDPIEGVGFERTLRLMRWGDQFRQTMAPYQMGRLAVSGIYSIRDEAQRLAVDRQRKGVAYLVKSLMHPMEVEFLRSVYRQRFFMIATHQPVDVRRLNLEKKYKSAKSARAATEADLIIRIDAGDRPAEVPETFPWDFESSRNSLSTNATFEAADVFVSAESHDETLKRWCDQVFSYPFGAPTSDEFGMSIAYSAARRSTALGRPVGSAVISEQGEVLAVGWNNPALPGGGVATFDSAHGVLEHQLKPPRDSSDELRISAIQEFLERLFDPAWESAYEVAGLELSDGQRTMLEWLQSMRKTSSELRPINRDLVTAMASVLPLGSSRLFQLIEFGRSVHAEMAAITSAARQGISLKNGTLFVTTFPCHECARNVVAAGIRRLVFVEPYAKSLSNELYDASIVNRATSSELNPKKVLFEPFVGISPSRQPELFSSLPRKVGLRDLHLGGREPGQIIDVDQVGSQIRPSLLEEFREDGVDGSFIRHFRNAHLRAEDDVVVAMSNHFIKSYPKCQQTLGQNKETDNGQG